MSDGWLNKRKVRAILALISFSLTKYSPWCCKSVVTYLCTCLFEGKPTDYNYNHVSSLVDGPASNALMMSNTANAGRTNFTNKQLTVRSTKVINRTDHALLPALFVGVGERIPFQSIFDSSTTHRNRRIATTEWNTSEGKLFSAIGCSTRHSRI